MSEKYSSEWADMKQDTGWYRPTWATFYYTKSIYNFIWKSEENYNDNNLLLPRLSDFLPRRFQNQLNLKVFPERALFTHWVKG
jgi:hypothetical protein